MLLLSSPRLMSQPAIAQNGVVNQASQIPPTLAGGSLARGAAFRIRGIHFGPATVVSLRKGRNSTPIRVLTMSDRQIQAIVPETAPLGPASLVVTSGGSESKPFPVRIAASNPGIYSLNQRGWGPGRIENLASLGKRTPNSTANPARPGQRVAMRITGLSKGSGAPLVIGDAAVESGLPRALSAPGEQEVSVLIPQKAPTGCYVPVYFRDSTGRPSNVVTMSIRSGTGSCEPGPVPLLDKPRIGIAVFSRSNMLNGAVSTTMDEAFAVFTAKDEGPPVSPLLLLPPLGTCTFYTSSFQVDAIRPDSLGAVLISEIGGEGLAAGTELSAEQGKNNLTIPEIFTVQGFYHANLGSYRGNPRKLLLEPGKFVFSSPGGTDVGAFRVAVESPERLEWANRGQIYRIDRTRALPLTWRKQAGDHVIIILATNVDQLTTATGTCLCTASSGATRFEIPAGMLANIPASSPVAGFPYDQIYISSIPARGGERLQAAGIGAGAVVVTYASGRFVQYY